MTSPGAIQNLNVALSAALTTGQTACVHNHEDAGGRLAGSDRAGLHDHGRELIVQRPNRQQTFAVGDAVNIRHQ